MEEEKTPKKVTKVVKTIGYVLAMFLERIAKLIDVKSIVTLALTGTFMYLVIMKLVSGDKFYDLFLMVISYYFGTQMAKKEG